MSKKRLSCIKITNLLVAKLLLALNLLLTILITGLPISVQAGNAGADSPLYQEKCAMCHGNNGVAILPGTPSFSRSERLEKPDNALLQSVMNGKNAMPPFKGMLTDAQVKNILVYIRKFQ